MHIVQDFIIQDDLTDSDTPHHINLTIEDFNSRGQVANPRAPCIVTIIDPDYTKDAALQRRSRKFRMKTDILRLREITRKKIIIYATHQRYLEKQRETGFQEYIFQRVNAFQKFACDALYRLESNIFTDMRQAQKQYSDLQKVKITEELKDISAEHQRVLMEVQEVYGRFLSLLKLISYFDEIISAEDIENDQQQKLPQSDDIVKMHVNERSPVGKREVANIIEYMDSIIRPYLSKRKHLNANTWIKGYESTREKVFKYNRRLMHVALLNHLVFVINAKSEKTFARRTQRTAFLLDPKFLTSRIEFLMGQYLQMLNGFQRRQKKDEFKLKLNAMVPVILQRIEMKTMQADEEKNNYLSKTKDDKLKASTTATEYCTIRGDGILIMVKEMQWNLMNLLQDLEMYPPKACNQVESHVRKRFEMEKDISRRALIKKNRLYNWMQHYRKHEELRQKKLN